MSSLYSTEEADDSDRPPPHNRVALTEAMPGFPVGSESEAFYRRVYPESTTEQWCDWRWQLRHRITTVTDLSRVFDLSKEEIEAVVSRDGSLPLGITPYYASLMSRTDPTEPLRKSHVPTTAEFVTSPGDMEDPLAEDDHEVAPGLVHRYPDRVLLLATNYCPTYCRYCLRSRRVGDASIGAPNRSRWDQAIAYIADHPEVRDVLISGGDPLTMGESQLDYLLSRIRAISHVEMIRIGSKVPFVLPMRITGELVRVLKKYHPLYMSLHATHPREITPEAVEATRRLADAGIPLGSQTVLLKGINDDIDTIRALMHALLKCRVRPYYLFQCDPVRGSGHLRTSVAKGIEIIEELRGHTSGYAVPTFAIDGPGGGGKIPLLPEYVVEKGDGKIVLRNYEGKIFTYLDSE